MQIKNVWQKLPNFIEKISNESSFVLHFYSDKNLKNLRKNVWPTLKMLYLRTTGLHSRILFLFKFLLNHPPAEHNLCSNLYQTTLQLYEKRFHDIPDVRTMKLIIKLFQTEYMLDSALRSNAAWSGRSPTLSDNDRTKIAEHADENLSMSVCCVAQELGLKCKTIRTTLKKVGYFPYQISVLYELKLGD